MTLPKTNKQFTIGLLITNLFSAYNINIWSGIVKKAKENDVNLLNFIVESFEFEIHLDHQKNNILDLIHKKKIDGLISVTSSLPPFINVNKFEQFLKPFSSIPIVNIGASIKNTYSALVNNKKGLYDLMIHLIEFHKYKRIAFFRGPKGHIEAEQRFNVYKYVLKSHKIPIDNKLIYQGDFALDSFHGKNGVKVLLDERKVVFDVIVCANDDMAINAIIELKSRGFKVPEDIAVTGFDDSDENLRILKPALTTVSQPVYELGQNAFDILYNKLNGKKVKNRIIIPTKLMVRNSCGCLQRSQEKNIISCKTKNTFKKNNLKSYLISNIENVINENLVKINDLNIKHDWSIKLADSLFSDLEGISKNKFLMALEDVILKGIELEIEPLIWKNIINKILDNLKKNLKNTKEINFIYNLLKDSLSIIINIISHLESFSKFKNRDQNFELYKLSVELISIADKNKFKDLIIEDFPKIGINSCYIYLFKNNAKHVELFFAYNKKEKIKIINNPKKNTYNKFIVDILSQTNNRIGYNIMSLFYKEIQIGFVCFEIGPIDGILYEILSMHLSSALRGIDLVEKLKKHSENLKIKVKERTIKLEEANNKLKDLDRLKNDFIANITHDFRSPLTVILNIADLALKYKNDENNHDDNYKIIYNSSLQLKYSIDRLLEIARMDAKGLKINIKKIQLISILDKMVNYYTSAFTNTGITITTDFPSNEIENFYTDQEKLEEIINNIISNASKFVDIKNGKIIVKLEDKKDKILLSIIDNGIGIPKDKLKIIFKRFESAYNIKNNTFSGTGIGLAFSKQLVEYLKGRIWAESEGEGKGAKFFIELKKGKNIFDEKDFTDKETHEVKKTKDMKNILQLELSRKTQNKEVSTFFKDLNKENEYDYKKGIILIIDDDIYIVKIVMEYLINYGYKNFITSTDSKQALDAVYEYSPDLIICDYNMPDMKGDEFHNEILSNPKYKNIPFIFLSAVANNNFILERREKGASAYLKKPIDEKDLQLSVEQNLKKYFEYLNMIHLATTDELTYLNNRRYILNSLNHELLIRVYRNLSIIFFDIDFFKKYNDNYGHKIGDKILKSIGKIIKESIRAYDIAGRYGGDEFIIILPYTNISQAKKVAEQLRNKIKQNKIKYENSFIQITGSFGLASLIDNEEYIFYNLKQKNQFIEFKNLKEIYNIKNPKIVNWDELNYYKLQISDLLIQMSDNALYKAKRTICNKCNFNSEKIHFFKNNKCPKCNSDDLIIGRDRIELFK